MQRRKKKWKGGGKQNFFFGNFYFFFSCHSFFFTEQKKNHATAAFCSPSKFYFFFSFGWLEFAFFSFYILLCSPYCKWVKWLLVCKSVQWQHLIVFQLAKWWHQGGLHLTWLPWLFRCITRTLIMLPDRLRYRLLQTGQMQTEIFSQFILAILVKHREDQKQILLKKIGPKRQIRTKYSLDVGSISPTFFCTAFTPTDPKSAKRQSTQAPFCTFKICEHKSCE